MCLFCGIEILRLQIRKSFPRFCFARSRHQQIFHADVHVGDTFHRLRMKVIIAATIALNLIVAFCIPIN